ncbi:hypothetical protein DN069_09605 [Streptacidiphilus pinicola]|uniref:Twin-arginine translocation signal domain-containing protein n=1 Tax=Streptacidiphilus pinicola TaxID=2219663 RepID=A0A2X0J634_9ACTN|nr:hypothetical protein [Streptacidiphilus pinicola]RAG85756.1 hypothetical protein DN069_09605 [Streptacidiphilus pinicola]
MSSTPEAARPDHPDRSDGTPPLSRRRLIKQATAAGAVTVVAGLALGARADAAVADTSASHSQRPGRNEQDEPLIVRVVDAHTGELDFFQGQRHHRVRDAQLVAELLRASR